MSEHEEQRQAEDEIVLHNGSQRVFRTRRGVLAIGGTLAFGADEAKELLAYPGVRDVRHMAPQTAQTIDGLKKRIAYLEEENKNLLNQVEMLTPDTKVPAPEPEPEEQPEPEKAPEHKAKKGKR